jgi:hypothetical protein
MQALLGKLRQQPRVPLAKGGRRQLGCRYLRQQGSGDCWQSPVGKENDSFANSIGLCCWQSRRALQGEAHLCQQPGPKLLAKLATLVGKAQICQQLWPMLLAKLGIFPFSFAVF